MFSWITSWFGGGSGSADKEGLVGSFYTSQKPPQWKCVYMKSRMYLKMIGKGSFNVVVERVFDEGERELEQECGGSAFATTMEFPLSGSMQMSVVRENGSQIQFLWREIKRTGLVSCKFQASEDTTDAKFESFIIEMGKALCTVLNGFTPSEQECTFANMIKQFEGSSPKSSFKAPPPAAAAATAVPESRAERPPASQLYPSLDAPSQNRDADLASSQMDVNQIPASAFHEVFGKQQVDPSVLPPRVSVPTLAGETVASVPCSLYSWDSNAMCYNPVCARCLAIITQASRYDFTLYVLDVLENPADLKDAPIIVGQKIDNSMNPYFRMEDRSITWSFRLGNMVWVWCAIFPDVPQDIAFKDLFSKCLYEATSHKPFDKVREEDKAAIMNVLRDKFEGDSEAFDSATSDSADDEGILQAMGALSLKSKSKGGIIDEEDEEEDEENVEEEEEEEEEEDKKGGREEEDDDEDDQAPAKKDYGGFGKNKLLSVSAKHHRALVCRGKKIGVFSAENPDSGLRFATIIKDFKNKQGRSFEPKKMMLHHGEEQLFMLPPCAEGNKVADMDLNRGEIVSEWGTGIFRVTDIIPQSKYAGQTLAPTVLGMNSGGFFMMDPRVDDKSKVVIEQTFLSKASHFTCGATTANGDVVLGTESGEIRLYSANMVMKGQKGDLMDHKNLTACTTFTGFGDPIKSVDVTHDGKYVVATCSTYLLLVKTEDAAGNSGFTKRLGRNKIPPRHLHLKPQHMRLLGATIDFTPAKFDVGDDMERSIVTSTGPFVITWDFRKAKQNKLDYYRIVRLSDGVVADQFRFGDCDTVVVAMPDEVTLARKVLPSSSTRR